MDLSFNEHLIIFISVIYAFIASTFLLGWGRMARNLHDSSISVLYIGWTILLSFFVVQTWWENFQLKGQMASGIGYFYMVLIALAFLFLTGYFMFPDQEQSKSVDYNQYFFENKNKVFLCAIGYLLTFMLIAAVFKKIPFFARENLIRAAAIIALTIAAFSNNRKVHAGILAVAALLLAFFVIFFRWKSGIA